MNNKVQITRILTVQIQPSDMAKAHQSLIRHINVKHASCTTDDKMMIGTFMDENEVISYLRSEGIEVYHSYTNKVQAESATDYVKRMANQMPWINKLGALELSELYDIAINAKYAGTIEGIYSINL